MKNHGRIEFVSRKWISAACTCKFDGDVADLRTFVQAEARKTGSRLVAISSREGLLRDPASALCAAVWLLGDYHSTSTKYRLLEKQRSDLYRFLRGLANEIGSDDVHYLVSRLIEQPPQSRRNARLGSLPPPRLAAQPG